MLCDICKTNEATVHLTQIAEGKVTKADLCEACAKAKMCPSIRISRWPIS